MVKKTSYLSEPQHLGAKIEVPKSQVGEKDLPEILSSEQALRRDEASNDVTVKKIKSTEVCGYYPVTVEELFSKLVSALEEKEMIGYSKKEDPRKVNYVTQILCNMIGAKSEGDELFYAMSNYLRDAESFYFCWEKEDEKNIHLEISYCAALKAEVFIEETLLECFEKAEAFFAHLLRTQ